MASQWTPDFKGLIKLQPEACNCIKKETVAKVFSYEFCEISKITSFTEHLWVTASFPTMLTEKKK